MKITNNEIIKETILNELKEIKVDRNNSISLYKHYFYEEIMTTLFGKDIFTWINKQL